MRKILIGIIFGVFLICSVRIMVYGIENVNIYGIYGIQDKNEKVDETINSLSNVISTTYQNTLANEKKAATTLTNSKTEYENQAALSSLNSSSYASQMEKYEIDFLWTKLGNYAKEENVVIKIDVTSNEASSNLYNLGFSVTGNYVNITDFIYDIENDSRLGFRIDDFSMGMSGNELLATFSCKEISLNVGQIEGETKNTSTENSSDEKTNTNTNTQNNTNTINSNTTANTSATANSSTNVTNTTNTTENVAE